MQQVRRQVAAALGQGLADGPDRLHDVKYYGYRMMVIRKQDRVRLISAGGHDWAGRFPLRSSRLP